MYAPARTRALTLGLFALDTRLAGIVRAAREPMMAQLRLAWWREQLQVPVPRWPIGEPLLTALRGWDGETEALAALVDGWEAMTAAPPLDEPALAALAQSRGNAFAALARHTGANAAAAAAAAADAARRAAFAWSLADTAARLTRPDERASARAMVAAHDWRRIALPRGLRPLAVLHGLAARGATPAAAGKDHDLATLPPRALLTCIRIGLMGR